MLYYFCFRKDRIMVEEGGWLVNLLDFFKIYGYGFFFIISFYIVKYKNNFIIFFFKKLVIFWYFYCRKVY